MLNTGFATFCNNDHGISPDNKWLVISHNDKKDPSPKPYKSAIYILPIAGGEPRRITPEVPSFWHGWSPDSKVLAYCAERNRNFDIYTIGTEGGTEKRKAWMMARITLLTGNTFISIHIGPDTCRSGGCSQMDLSQSS
jgi:TolB protein